ncbi:TadE/TadG family type IV pilus assembly protein [Croceibacterium ferulae]|uniref:TadE/TadG family type IV pilus assembly protein n=1 Tax=Croceibacterium ferulae TaxID=1854641 RepID=UPI000EB1DAF0|nr:TadE/TadG family type IV pilus assembly protein [Croceibacterium ferulae]
MPARARKAIRTLWRCRRGVTAVEFALTLPVFLGLMGAAIELSFVMITSMKVQRLATMTADLVARDGASEHRLTEAQIYDILYAMDVAAQPLDVRGRGRVIVSAVMGQDLDDNGTGDTNRIMWQRFDGGLTRAPRLIGCWSITDRTSGIPRQLNAGEPLFHAQVSYAYDPMFSRAFVKWLQVPEVITRTATFRGRGAIYHPVLAVEGYTPKDDCLSASGL